ncbi:MAG: hypothetical protein AAFR87_24495 [Bacteroidota bacterium]
MENLTHFSIDKELKSLRQRFSKSGAFTYDNIDELESHIRDGYELHKEEHSEKEAYQLSMESLGDPAELTELYYKSNQQSIWRNYFWIISLSTFFGLLVYRITDFMFQVVFTAIDKLGISVEYDYMDYGFGLAAGIVFVLLSLSFRKRASRIFHSLTHRLLRRPSFALLGVFVIGSMFNNNIGPSFLMENLSSEIQAFARSAQGIYAMFMYLAPLILLFIYFWKYKHKEYKSFEEKLSARLGLCALLGVSMTIFVILSSMILAEGVMGLVILLDLNVSIYTQFAIPMVLFVLFWLSLIFLLYQQPQQVLGRLSQIISENTMTFLSVGLSLLVATFLLADFTGTLFFEQMPNEHIGEFFYLRDLWLEKIFTFFLLLLTTIWTFRRSKNRRMIAWN